MEKKHFFALTIIFIFLGMTGGELQAQSKKEEAHKLESLQADAWAMTYLTCTLNLNVHYWTLKPDDKDLRDKANAASATLSGLQNKFSVKYHQDSATFKRFDKEMAYANKKLKVCLKYQGILDAKALSEKEKMK